MPESQLHLFSIQWEKKKKIQRKKRRSGFWLSHRCMRSREEDESSREEDESTIQSQASWCLNITGY